MSTKPSLDLTHTQQPPPGLFITSASCLFITQALTRHIQPCPRPNPSQTAISPPTQLLHSTQPLHSTQNRSAPTTLGRNLNPSAKPAYASVINPATVLNPAATLWLSKSFVDTVSGSTAVQSRKSVSLLLGEPAIYFSTAKIQSLAEPFKLSHVGEFSFSRTPMDVIRKFIVSLSLKGSMLVSLLDNRHVLIKLQLKEDYYRIWVRQSRNVNGKSMRIFK